jgi:hypothetical protein
MVTMRIFRPFLQRFYHIIHHFLALFLDGVFDSIDGSVCGCSDLLQIVLQNDLLLFQVRNVHFATVVAAQ